MGEFDRRSHLQLPEEPQGQIHPASRVIFRKIDAPGTKLDEIGKNSETSILDNRERRFLTLAARGFKRPEIGQRLGLKTPSVDKIATGVNNTFDTNSTLHAILTALDRRLISPRAILKGFDRTRLEKLTETQVEVLEKAIANNGRNGSNKKLATTFVNIHSTLGTQNKEQSIAVYASSKLLPEAPNAELDDLQTRFLTQMATGGTYDEIAKQLRVSVPTITRTFMPQINALLQTDSLGEAVITALEKGLLSTEKILASYETTKLEPIRPADAELLEKLLDMHEGELSYQDIGIEFGVTKKAITNRYQRLFKKLGFHNRTHALAVYAAMKKNNENPVAFWGPRL